MSVRHSMNSTIVISRRVRTGKLRHVVSFRIAPELMHSLHISCFNVPIIQCRRKQAPTLHAIYILLRWRKIQWPTKARERETTIFQCLGVQKAYFVSFMLKHSYGESMGFFESSRVSKGFQIGQLIDIRMVSSQY